LDYGSDYGEQRPLSIRLDPIPELRHVSKHWRIRLIGEARGGNSKQYADKDIDFVGAAIFEIQRKSREKHWEAVFTHPRPRTDLRAKAHFDVDQSADSQAESTVFHLLPFLTT
jgi:hypothetical protein